jgi:hypothetical protein
MPKNSIQSALAYRLCSQKIQQRQIEERSHYPAKVSAVSQKRYNMNKCNQSAPAAADDLPWRSLPIQPIQWRSG